MQLPTINFRLLALAFGTSVAVFGLIFWLNRPASQVTPANPAPVASVDLPTPAPTPVTATSDYNQEFARLIQEGTGLAAGALDTFDTNPAILVNPTSREAEQLLRNLDSLTGLAHQAQALTPPADLTAIHQSLLSAYDQLEQADIKIISAVSSGDNNLLTTGYQLLESGYNALVATFSQYQAEIAS